MSNRVIENIRTRPQPPNHVLACSKLVLCIMPIAQISIGAVYLHECPKETHIPVYLIVVGVFGLMLTLLSWLPCSKQPEDGSSSPLNRACVVWNSLNSAFLFCWFIAGNVWIYSIYEPNYNRNTTDTDPYCHKTLYLFAFWTTTLVYIFFCVMIFIGCCVMCCFYLMGRADPDD